MRPAKYSFIQTGQSKFWILCSDREPFPKRPAVAAKPFRIMTLVSPPVSSAEDGHAESMTYERRAVGRNPRDSLLTPSPSLRPLIAQGENQT